MEKTRDTSRLPDLPGIYHFIKNEKIVYIGESSSIKRRVGQHILSNGEDFEVRYQIIDDEDERKQREAEQIREHRPELNGEVTEKAEVDLPSYLNTAEDFGEKVEIIENMTRLSKREAELYLFHVQEGLTLSEAAEEMGTKNEKNRWARVKEKIWKAEETAELEIP